MTYQVMPRLSEKEYEELKADIQERGVLVPVEYDEAGNILDGHHRVEICGELNITEWPRIIRRGMTEPEKKDHALTLNMARRHLTKEQRRDIWQEMRLQGKTLQEIAEKDGTVNLSTVSRALEGDRPFANAKAEITIQGKDGKSYPAKYAPRKSTFLSSEDMRGANNLPPEYRDSVLLGQSKPTEAMRTMKRDQVVASLESVEAMEVKQAAGLYDVMVIDPPWPMQKIERDVTPNQVAFEYPTAAVFHGGEEPCGSIECIVGDLLQNNTAKDCHVWIWTTQKYLFDAYELLSKRWGLKYVCTFVWHKPGGFQPFDLPQYNCEFALYARKGSPKFIDTKAFPLCFNAPRKEHSAKPEEFYDVVRRVTAGRRLDVFNRRKIDGFDGWGQESK